MTEFSEIAVDEVLEALWTESEKGQPRDENVRRAAHASVDEKLLSEVESRGLMKRNGGVLELTDEGFRRARGIIRRHRLAERLVRDVLSASPDEMEVNACEYEHVLASGVTESICTLLGHPRECPHGRTIPEGPCCREAREKLAPLLASASRMQIGETARLAYVHTKIHARLQKLSSFGLTPGVRVKLLQKRPAFVLQFEETELALEEILAGEIYVLREPD